MSKILIIENPEECPYCEVDALSFRGGEYVCVYDASDRQCNDMVDFPSDCPLKDEDQETGLEYE